MKSWSGNSNSVDEKVREEKLVEEQVDREDDAYNREFDSGKVNIFLF